MTNAHTMRCPNCDYLLSCGYYGGTSGGRVVQCERCGLRGPASESVDDEVDAPLALFARHCTAAAANDILDAIRKERDERENAARTLFRAGSEYWKRGETWAKAWPWLEDKCND